MSRTFTFSSIKFGTVRLIPEFDENGMVDFALNIDAGLLEDEERNIVVAWNNYAIPLSAVEKAAVIAWLKNVVKPKIETLLGL